MSAIETLQRELKSAYLHYRRLADSRADYSCGNNLLEHIRPDIGAARMEVNRILAQMRAIDPTAPKDLT